MSKAKVNTVVHKRDQMKPMLEDLLEKSKDLIAYPKDDEENWREEEITKLSARFQEEKDNFDSAQDKVSVEISCLATKNGEDEQEAIEAEAAGHQSLLLRFMHASGDLRALLRVISEEGEKSRDYPAKAAKVAAEQEHWAAEQKEHQLRMEQLQAEHEVKMEQLASDQRAIRLKEQEYQEKQEKQRTIEEKAERQRLEAVEEERQRIREVHNMEMRDREEQAQVKLRVLERGGSSSSHSADEGHQQVKLPNLELPKFNGNPQEWPMYEAGIKATVECQRVTDYQKYFLLKSSLVEGSAAATAFKGWSYSPDRGDNFETAFRHLKSRFGDPNVIIQSHLSELTKLTVKSANVKELRNFLDIMDIHLQSLRSLVPGFGEGGTEILLIYQLQTKLPHSVRTIMESHLIQSGETAWTFDLFRTQLLNYIKVKENVGEPERTGSDPLRGIGTVPSRYPEYPVPSAIPPHVDTSGYPGTSKSPITPTNPCIFCNDMHWSNGCGNYPTIASRRKKLYENNICVKCLKTGHMEKDCKSSTTCRFCQNPSHNRALCQENLTKYPVQKGTGSTLVSIQNAAAEENQTLKPPTDIVLMKTGSRSVLQTAWVEIRRPAYPRSVQTRVLLDSCSDCSYITLALAKQLNLPNLSREEEVEYSYYNFGSKKPCWNRYIPSEVDLVLKDKSILRIDVRIVDTITGAVPRYRIEDEDVIVALGNRDLADSVPRYTEREPVHFLIGQPAYMDIQTYRVEVKKNLFLQESKLGWILSGSIPVSEDDQKLPESTFLTLNNHSPVELPLFSNPDRVLTKMPNLTDFWDLQKIGISDDPQVIDEEEAQQQFDSKIEFRDDHRYYVPFPAKKGHDDLPENLELAKGRLISQVKRYQKKDPEILKKIDDIISDQLQKGVIEIVTVDTFEGPRKHYIPHHPVITPQKETTKVRLVYDASARTKVGSPSLNECLYKGAVILPDLAGVLLRSRVAPILMLSDIEKAFLQVGLLESDRDLTRFFWLRDFTQPPFGENVIVYRFCRVPFGVISSPYLLAATIRYHLSNVSTELANEIRKNIYVDNVMIAVKNHADAMDSYWKSKEIFNNCSMNLREWTSNCREVIDQIPAIDRAKGDTLKLLGLIWDCTNDIFYIPGSLKLLDLPCHSKRSLASSMAKVFDPLGYFSPVILRLKIILQQKVWSSKFDWDADLPEEIIEEWRTQLEDIKEISNHPIPRFIALHALPQPSYQLLCFTDASAQAYSTAVFLRGYTDSESRVNLIFSKSRLAPLQPLTIPRLELLGVLIGIRALQFVAAQLQMPIDFKCLWTDSKVVLGWLTSTKSLPKFVTNRLTEIKRLGKDTHFCYVPSEENPADIATRETTFAELKGCDMWWHGPAWLCHARKDWPNFNTPIISPENLNKLSQTQKPSFYQISLVTHHYHGEGPNGKEQTSVGSPCGIDIARLSSLEKLLRVTAWVKKFIYRVKEEARKRKLGIQKGPINQTLRFLTAKELKAAKLDWDLFIQRSQFPGIMNQLMEKPRKRSALVDDLGLYIDNIGLIRCQGRLGHVELPDLWKFPKLLPRRNAYTKLVILDAHQRVLHSKSNPTLAKIREEYWIPQGKQEVKHVLSECRVCRRVEGGPYPAPPMPPLPPERVHVNAPFTNTGVDYLGPLYIKSENGGTEKVWICLFTCMAIRAVHLELLRDMSALKFLEGLRKFIARRGAPKLLVSDNALQFKLTNKVLQKVWEIPNRHPVIQSYISQTRIEWVFITELSPWEGGFYERLVGNVKQSLRKTISRGSRLSWDELQTLLCEVEALINSRPLTVVGTEVEDYTLSPSDFLTLNLKTGSPVMDVEQADIYDPDYQPRENSAGKLIMLWKCGQERLRTFWKDWQEHYLQSLRARTPSGHKNPRIMAKDFPSNGDIVLSEEKGLPRGQWPLCRIEKLIPSQEDKEERKAIVRFPNRKLLKRPIRKLYPLECGMADVEDFSEDTDGIPERQSCVNDKSNNVSTTESSAPRYPKRRAAMKAQQVLRDHFRRVECRDTAS